MEHTIRRGKDRATGCLGGLGRQIGGVKSGAITQMKHCACARLSDGVEAFAMSHKNHFEAVVTSNRMLYLFD